MGLIPGMPNLAFLLIAGGLVWLGRRLAQRPAAPAAGSTAPAPAQAAAAPESQEASWDDVALVDPLGLEVGYRLIPLVDQARTASCWGASRASARSSRRRSASWCRWSTSATTSRFKPNAYVISLKGVRDRRAARPSRTSGWRSTRAR